MAKTYNPKNMKHYSVTWENGVVTQFAHEKSAPAGFNEEFIKLILNDRHEGTKLGKAVKVKRIK